MEQKQPISAGENAPLIHNLYNLEDLEMLSRNDDALLGNILSILVGMFVTEADNIRTLAAENKWQEVAEVAHKLKTSVTHIQALPVRQNIIDLEDYNGRSNDELNVLAHKLCNSLAEMKVHLQADLDNFNLKKSAQ